MKHATGADIMMSSIAGAWRLWQASYSTTKAGLVGLAKTLALEGARYNITVNAIVRHHRHRGFQMGRPDMNERMIKRVALRRPASQRTSQPRSRSFAHRLPLHHRRCPARHRRHGPVTF